MVYIPSRLGKFRPLPLPLSFDVSQNVTETKTARQRRLPLRFKNGHPFCFTLFGAALVAVVVLFFTVTVGNSSCGCYCVNIDYYSSEQLLWLLLC